MSLTVDSHAAGAPRRPRLSPEIAARVCATWAASGEFGEHVVYERDRRWTFAAGVAARIVVTTTAVIVTEAGQQVRTPWHGDPSAAVAEALDALTDTEWRVYGWIGFDYCAPFHGLVDSVPDGVVLAHLMVPEFEAFVDGSGVDTGTADDARAARLRELAATAMTPPGPTHVDVDVDHDDYRGRVAQAIDEINRGDYQKVIMSRRVDVPFDVDIPATYARGRAGNNPARSYLLDLGSLSAAGFSPELVLATEPDGTVITEPLAGTRAFGRSAELDAAARADLLADAKEIAEHAMSVQACFEEIASVSLPGTTVVSEFMVVRERGSVQHLASTVRGELSPEAGPWQALAVLFPSITASGIPKSAALEAIYRLEPDSRGLYSGAVVVASSAGDLEATLTLRSIFAVGNRAWLRAGAGIVGQSNPDREFEETCEKLGSVAPYVVRRHAEGSDRS
ncbi:salicylate synthase [Gordonia hankookensis]|uniref:Salicylate synthase n=1 Tax=Gordonia hankookensis TaxID=589403 RepID=A0ABR7WBF8_9ACTN|nr:salicylate synthase [Gordonia hankookensis]MBD1319876.1 salicylate synthase [Gordonia hankookensis]NDZ94436.1 salicylate synthase [Streptomyces sp. SID11726]NEB24616.1 salicylate synthase [Streptomyces sp. SID6673]